jgi:hypothetical protein
LVVDKLLIPVEAWLVDIKEDGASVVVWRFLFVAVLVPE